LFDLPNVSFSSLQVGKRGDDLARLARRDIVDLAPELTNFAETAAVVVNLDLVLTVDTAVAHLAGALGRRCWVMLPFAPDWRWLTRREDSPWYPDLRLFRQPAPGDWDSVIANVREALSEFQGRTGVPSVDVGHSG
jgi:ADP-heptose:LPS heptosyltransferase